MPRAWGVASFSKGAIRGNQYSDSTYVELVVIRDYNAQQKITSSLNSGSRESNESQSLSGHLGVLITKKILNR